MLRSNRGAQHEHTTDRIKPHTQPPPPRTHAPSAPKREARESGVAPGAPPIDAEPLPVHQLLVCQVGGGSAAVIHIDDAPVVLMRLHRVGWAWGWHVDGMWLDVVGHGKRGWL